MVGLFVALFNVFLLFLEFLFGFLRLVGHFKPWCFLGLDFSRLAAKPG